MMKIAVTVLAVVCTCFQSFTVVRGVCKDSVACDRYSPEICTDPQYFDWTHANCPSYCNLCSQPTAGSHIGVGKLMDSDGGSPTCKDAVSNCAEYGKVLCSDVKFYNWANENCRKHCNRCTSSCVDKLPNCAEYGSAVCTDLSFYNWVEMNCRKFCARCTP
ncbi:uncharacterized protein LOC132733121 [Ruditapes philippinarum]|uniref:uncharacterized protein LOC132733121 n=1 Tax=Ruditapes philippinarum TaxID=129788 RepID=UPI00295AA028|nr:uncharacterized protein LOC132733121 [Ruditapes philippinarum]